MKKDLIKKDLIIGSEGQIAKAIYKCYGNNKNKVLRYDLDSEEHILTANEDNIRCMHICIPCKDKDKFIDIVDNYIYEVKPEIVIIHSTIPLGTSREIYKHLCDKTIIVHSPCKGKHPDLYKSIKQTFTKYFGVIPNSDIAWHKVMGIFVKLFDKSYYAGKPENTEMAKILCTTEYAWHISIATEFKRYCKENNVDFNLVYNEFRKDYNEGYKEMGLGKFTRPMLEPCKDKILGHCVKENLVNLLKPYMKPTWLTDIKPKRLIK